MATKKWSFDLANTGKLSEFVQKKLNDDELITLSNKMLNVLEIPLSISINDSASQSHFSSGGDWHAVLTPNPWKKTNHLNTEPRLNYQMHMNDY
jgi:hypothetical protein